MFGGVEEKPGNVKFLSLDVSEKLIADAVLCVIHSSSPMNLDAANEDRKSITVIYSYKAGADKVPVDSERRRLFTVNNSCRLSRVSGNP